MLRKDESSTNSKGRRDPELHTLGRWICGEIDKYAIITYMECNRFFFGGDTSARSE